MNPCVKWFLMPILGVLLGFPAAGVSATRQAAGKIMFLTFTMKKDGSMVLKNSTVVPGSLKNRKTADDGDILYEVTKKSGTAPVRGALETPLVRHCEYPDANDPTVLKNTTIVDTMADFTVRLPYDADLSKISFFTKAGPSEAGASKTTGNVEFPKGKLLGSFALPAAGGAQ
jgi:hypothetical protein